jgi:hypothetical protein
MPAEVIGRNFSTTETWYNISSSYYGAELSPPEANDRYYLHRWIQ